MKAREQRHNVLIPARLRWERRWVPASLRNVSSRGMMLRLSSPPPKGSFVEIELANRIVTGQVMWSNNQACGFRLQDRIDVASLRGGRGVAGAQTAAAPVAARAASQADPAETAERSRRFAAMFQFAVLSAIGLIAAGLVATEAYHILAAPLDVITTQLN